MSAKHSNVWRYFVKSATEPSATCTMCNIIIKCKEGTTTAMNKHLKMRHTIDVNVKREEGLIDNPAKRPMIPEENNPEESSYLNGISPLGKLFLKRKKIENEGMTQTSNPIQCSKPIQLTMTTLPQTIFNKTKDKIEEIDEDRYFLMSLLSELKKIPAQNRFSVKIDIMKLIKNAQCTQTESDYPENVGQINEVISSEYMDSLNIEFSNGNQESEDVKPNIDEITYN